jgi:hypothetical protein
MSNRRLAIVFRNAHPQRGPIHSELCLVRRASSSANRNYPEQADCVDPKNRPRHLNPRNAASMSLS